MNGKFSLIGLARAHLATALFWALLIGLLAVAVLAPSSAGLAAGKPEGGPGPSSLANPSITFRLVNVGGPPSDAFTAQVIGGASTPLSSAGGPATVNAALGAHNVTHDNKSFYTIGEAAVVDGNGGRV
jgi:hypothetical protein